MTAYILGALAKKKLLESFLLLLFRYLGTIIWQEQKHIRFLRDVPDSSGSCSGRVFAHHFSWLDVAMFEATESH